LTQSGGAALSPSCRRCLTSIDRVLPSPPADARIEPLCALIVRAVEEYGYAEVTDVPGDQQNLLRSAARARIRKHLGFSTRTFTLDHRVNISCPAASEQEQARQRNDRIVRAVLEAWSLGERTTLDDSGWRFSWRHVGV
ncbi:MAG: hypothetical protein ACRD08_07095, partial [Acidimicrobiales bacterium]